MRRTGDVVRPGQYDTILTATETVDGPIIEAAREDLLAIGAGHARQYFGAAAMSPAVHALGLILADICETGLPVGGLAHHTIPLGWHQDRQAPHGTWNITILFRSSLSDDLLVIDKTAWRIPDRGFVCFDNQQWHGVTPFDRTCSGYRIALTYYVPAP